MTAQLKELKCARGNSVSLPIAIASRYLPPKIPIPMTAKTTTKTARMVRKAKAVWIARYSVLSMPLSFFHERASLKARKTRRTRIADRLELDPPLPPTRSDKMTSTTEAATVGGGVGGG